LQETSFAPEKIYFIADAHLGANSELEKDTAPALLGLLDEVARERAGLYILGDLYDFWFEFRDSVTKIHPSVLAKLYELRDRACPIGFAAGNHDFWMADFLERELGATVSADWIELELQGKKVCMAHGDGLASGDTAYKLLKKVLRSRVNIALYKLLPANLGVAFALGCSRLSRKTSLSEMARNAEELFHQVALKRFREGFDIVVLGHVHLPYEREHEGGKFFIVGDWINNLSYLVMEGGQMRRRLWTPELGTNVDAQTST
jgi:UDP-2,3-diacylglucosamine hydrolase